MKWLPYDEETSNCSEFEYESYKLHFKNYYEPTFRLHSSVIKIIEKYYNMDPSNVDIDIDGPFSVMITEDEKIRIVLVLGSTRKKAKIIVAKYDKAFNVYIFESEHQAKEHLKMMADSVGAVKA